MLCNASQLVIFQLQEGCRSIPARPPSPPLRPVDLRKNGQVTLHGNPIHETVRLPDGREATVWVGIPEDSYVADRDLNTVVLELRVGRGVLAVVTTILNADQSDEARHLARRVAEGLHSGELEPHASALEHLADEIL